MNTTVIAIITKDDSRFLNSVALTDGYFLLGNELILLCEPSVLLPDAVKNKNALLYINEGLLSDVELIEIAVIQLSNRLNDILIISEDVAFRSDIVGVMSKCLYTAEKHGIVSARCDVSDLKEAVLMYLPEWNKIPLPSCCCSLLKRTTINNLGFIDSEYKTIGFALYDFALKINEFGFNTVYANRAVVDVGGLAAFDTKCDEDTWLIASRYGYFRELQKRYDLYDKHPCDVFLRLLDTERKSIKRILFNFSVVPPFHNGTSEMALMLFQEFYASFHEKYELFILTNHEADEFHKMSKKYTGVLFPETISGIFDLGFSPTQPFYLDQYLIFNRYCLRCIFSVLDIIALRSYNHQNAIVQRDEIFRLGMKLCDGVLTISEFSKHDCLSYFENDAEIMKKPIQKVYIATNFGDKDIGKQFALPFDDYVLVVGNTFKHKAISETLDAIAGNKGNKFIVIGFDQEGEISDNIHGYKGGGLAEEFLSYLYKNCKAVVFPSMYEGFGLPIAIALKFGKRIVICNNELNRELQGHFSDFKDYIFLFDELNQINQIIDDIDFDQDLPKVKYNYSWKCTAIETERFFTEILSKPIDANRLKDRWDTFNFLEEKLSLAPASDPTLVAASGRDAIKAYVKQEYPSVFKMAKRIIRLRDWIRNIVAIPTANFGEPYNRVSEGRVGIDACENANILFAIDIADVVLLKGEKVMALRGWAFENDKLKEQGQVYLTLGKRGKRYFFLAQKVYRPDVAKAFAESGMQSGFSVNIPLKSLAYGTWDIGVCVKRGNEYFYKTDEKVTLKSKFRTCKLYRGS